MQGKYVYLTPADQTLVGTLLADAARIIANSDPNFVQGNPIMLAVPLDLKDTELAVAMQLKPKGKPTGLFTPDGRELLN